MPVVVNTEPRFHGIPVGGKVIQLAPGANEVPQATVDAMRKHSIVRAKLDRGVFIIRDTDGGITSMKVAEAKELIGETYDVDQLRRWKGEDSRKGVQDALAAQIAEIVGDEGDAE